MLDKLRNAVLLVVGGLVAVWAISGLVGVVQGGDMDPPGPPGGTLKPLFEVEPRTAVWPPDPGGFPYVINQPGSYYLTRNFYGEAGKNGIEIRSDNVTLDLMGFAVIGPGKGVGSDDGVYVGSQYNISILNGTVRDWGGDGIDADWANSSEFRGLRVYNNGAYGILTGAECTAAAIEASYNGNTGMYVEYACVVTDCVVSSNGFHGMYAMGNNNAVSNCVASGNGGNGITIPGGGAVITNNVADGNDEDGIEVCANNVVTGNNAVGNDHDNNNTGAGIHVTGTDNRIEGNNATSNDIGFDVDGGGNIVIKNSASGNTTASFAFAANNTYGEVALGAQEPIPDTVNSWANFSY